jgi:glycosyltransferase involved in cell wall biosynthesis
MKLSVIMLAYNHAKYISEAIQSVLVQEVDFDYELVIGEDHSSDDTLKIALDFHARFPEKIRIERGDTNVGSARNFFNCFNKCSGEYIALLEADDFWVDPMKLKKQVLFLDSHPEYGLVHGDVNHLYQETGRLVVGYNRSNNIQIPQGNIFEALLAPNAHIVKTMTVCFRKELAVRHFDFQRPIAENWPLTDLPLWLDVAYNSKVHYFSEVFSTYRLLSESASRTKSPVKQHHFHNEVFRIKSLYFLKYNVRKDIVFNLTLKYYETMLVDAFRMGDKELARKYFSLTKDIGRLKMYHRIVFWATIYPILKRLIGILKEIKSA